MLDINFSSMYLIDENGNKTPCEYSVVNDDASFKIESTVKQNVRLKEAVLFSGKHGLSDDAAFYGDGYQKLSQYKGTVGNFKTITGYTDEKHYRMPQTDGYKTVYNYILVGEGENTVLIGASSCNRFRTEFRINSSEIQIVQCLENTEYSENDRIDFEEMIVLKGKRNEILSRFAKAIAKNHPTQKYFEMPVGWCSWYCIGPDISENDIFENLKIIKEKTPELKYIQIDDGFQPYMGDWLETSDKFNRPMKEICHDIRNAGFEPAIWLAPFIASPKSRLLREHPEYFVKDGQGKPLCSSEVTFKGWRDGPWYMLDGTNPDAQKFIYDTVREIYKEWGVRYFKLDANVWGALPFGERYDKSKTSVEAYRMGMQAILDATDHKAFILGCNAPMWASLGVVSGMRVTNDVIRNVYHMANLSEQCFNRNWMHGKLWVNDPDCLIMSNTVSPVMDPSGIVNKSVVNRKFYRLNNIYVRASGGMVLSGDYVSKYSAKDVERLKKILDTDYVPALFDDSLEVGRKKSKNATEFFIFNRKSLLKKYEIEVPFGYTAVDLYKNTPLCVKNGKVTLYLTLNDSAWIEIKKL